MSMKTFLENDLLHTAHRHLLNVLQKHNNGGFSVGVRGNITEIACKNGGFNHCVSLGCPSLTINRSPNLGQDLKSKWNKTLVKLKKGNKIKIGLPSGKVIPNCGLALIGGLQSPIHNNTKMAFILDPLWK